MEIQEAESAQEVQSTYMFEIYENKILEDKQLKELLVKWGMDKGLQMYSFRFNQKYDDIQSDLFLVDLFNDKQVRSVLQSVSLPKENIQKVKAQKLRTTQIRLDMLDKCEANGIVFKDQIKGTLQDAVNEIQVENLLREAIIMEESELYETFDASDRQEFLFRIFQSLVLGGQMCQYDDNLSVYADWTKYLYKNLITARKDGQTGNIFIDSFVYDILEIDKFHKYQDHPQNFLYVAVNPSTRTVHLFSNQWIKYW